MTIIVGVKTPDGKVLLGADSQGSAGYNSIDRADPKVFITHGIGYGFTSSYRMGQVLRYHSEDVVSELRNTDVYGYVVTCLVPMWRRILKEHGYTAVNNNEETGGVFLVAIDGELFKVEEDFQVGESKKPYAAAGCGTNYALGNLFAHDMCEMSEDTVRMAITAAKEFSNGCGGDINIIEVGGSNE